MRFTYNQYNYCESGYRIPAKMHSSGPAAHQHQHQHQHHHSHKSNYGMRMTMSTTSTMTPRIHRKGFRTPSKRHPGKALPGKLHSISRIGPGKIPPGKRFPPRPHPPPCDNSNDSGFGFDQHLEVQQTANSGSQTSNGNSSQASIATSNSSSNHSQVQHTPQQHLIRAIPASRFISNGTRAVARVAHKRQPAASANSVATSSDGRVQLEIVSQPEQQHRARYQTEGSRGAVKDRSGNGFPVVRLIGYDKAALLQVFIGTDMGRVAPHMFYQACKVAGKNSTQCNEKKLDGTMVIEIELKPETDMTITCDCVGILKERNVDVEHRFPDHLAQKNKKKSTRCRMVFRTQLARDDGSMETLQVCSNPIICTQPPGVPEICKKSLNSCPVDGGLELFIIGKNFLKDTHVIFQEVYDGAELDASNSEIAVCQPMVGALWEQTVMPDKEYLQQTHLICTVPPYIHQTILKPVTVHLAIISSGKKSESHAFIYTPKGSYTALAAATTLSNSLHGSLSTAQDSSQYMDTNNAPEMPGADAASALWTTETKHELDSGMMPPPITTQMPMGVRRPSLPTSTPMITDQQLAHLNAVTAEALKTELLDETSQNSLADAMHSPEADPLSPTAPLPFHTRYGRKPSMDAMLYESSSMPGFPVTPAAAAVASAQMDVVAAAVEMAVQNEIAKEIHAAVVQQHQQQQQQQHIGSVVAPHPQVDKFFDNLSQSDVVAVGSGAEQSLFGAVAQAAASPAVTIFPTEHSNAAAIEHAFSDMMHQAAVVGSHNGGVLKRSLSISSSSSSHSNGSNSGSPLAADSGTGGSTSPVSSLNSHSSPLTQDMLLNAEPGAALNANLPLQHLLHSNAVVGEANVVTVAAAASPENTLSTDIIMNPAVSPSTILCSANGAATAVVPNIMTPHQVTMANSILNDIAMQSQPTQQDATVAALALSNIIIGQPTGPVNGNSVQQQPVVQPEVTAATSTAVSNMIIKAAADYISNQEQHHQQQHHQQQQHQQQQQQLSATESMLMSLNNSSGASVTSADPLVNLLLSHDVTNSAAAAATQAAAVAAEFPLGMPPVTPQESLIVALATENVMHKAVAAVAAAAAASTTAADVTQQTAAAGILPASVVSGVAAPAVPLPPELTTMSDQDLISYINPSTFDQV